MSDTKYIEFVRTRITELRIQKDVSEHKMSLDLDKSGSYIRGITSGAAMPSVKELFNIIAYFNMTPVDFFAPLGAEDTPYSAICERLRSLDNADLEKVSTHCKIPSLQNRNSPYQRAGMSPWWDCLQR